MRTTRLGRTDLQVTRTVFGVLPIQRTDREEAARILRRAQDAGINFYDTARGYTDSDWQEKMGRIEDCEDCGACRERCPYELDPPAMLKKSLDMYRAAMTDAPTRPTAQDRA